MTDKLKEAAGNALDRGITSSEFGLIVLFILVVVLNGYLSAHYIGEGILVQGEQFISEKDMDNIRNVTVGYVLIKLGLKAAFTQMGQQK